LFLGGQHGYFSRPALTLLRTLELFLSPSLNLIETFSILLYKSLADNIFFWPIVIAVVFMVSAGSINHFVESHPTVKVLALSFFS